MEQGPINYPGGSVIAGRKPGKRLLRPTWTFCPAKVKQDPRHFSGHIDSNFPRPFPRQYPRRFPRQYLRRFPRQYPRHFPRHDKPTTNWPKTQTIPKTFRHPHRRCHRRRCLSAPPGDDLIGTLYLNKYELDSVLGTGGMGVIYKGRQIFLDRTVAIKMLKSDLAGDKVRLRFHQEAKAASQLSHPGIVAINDFGVDDLDRPYMVMEYVEGCTLSELLRERRTLAVKDSLPIFLEICDALSAAHIKGIVHRDLKPSNIMLVATPDGKVHIKLLDFGIARILDIQEQTLQSLTKPGEALGTPLYMSPEQITGRKITHASDLYSLGCLMYASLTGTPPFIADSKLATLEKHCLEKPMPFRKVTTAIDFPPGIEQVVLRLLEKRPEDRFANVDQLKDALIDMAVQNGYMSRPESLAGGSGQLYLTGAIPEMPKSIVDMVPKGPATQAFDALFDVSHSSKAGSGISSGVPDFSTTGQFTIPSVPDTTESQEVTPVKGVFRKSSQHDDDDLTRRLPTREQERSRERELERERARARAEKEDGGPLEGIDEDLEKSAVFRVDRSINQTFALGTAIMLVLMATAVAFSLSWHPQKPPVAQSLPAKEDAPTGAPDGGAAAPKTIDQADKTIEQHLGGGAQDSFLSLRDQLGLSEKGIKALSQFKLLSSLDLSGTNVSDDQVKQLAAYPLRTLYLDNNFSMSNWCLRPIGQMKSLQSLSLASTRISDDGLTYLSRSPSLVKLFLTDNHHITDKGVADLGPKTSHLQTLILSSCAITDDAAADLLHFKNLTVLDVSKNDGISDKTVLALQGKVKALKILAVAGDDIKDEGIAALKNYKELEVLDLSFIRLSRKAQVDLATLKKLKCIYLKECGLSTPEIEKLRDGLPGIRIETSMRYETDTAAQQSLSGTD